MLIFRSSCEITVQYQDIQALPHVLPRAQTLTAIWKHTFDSSFPEGIVSSSISWLFWFYLEYQGFIANLMYDEAPKIFLARLSLEIV